MNRKKIALLIDYDNFNNKEYLEILLDELNSLGDVLIKYAYYSNLEDKKIKIKFIELGIEPVSQIAYSSGKNAVDIKMTIEAVMLIEKDYIDTICLASSDADFTPLVYFLKKNNKYVVGAGDNRATETYMNSFDDFVSVEKIYQYKVNKEKVKNTPLEEQKYYSLVKKVDSIIQSDHDSDGFADFSYVILTLKNDLKDFNPKNYGAKNKQVLPFFLNDLKEYYEVKQKEAAHFIRRVIK